MKFTIDTGDSGLKRWLKEAKSRNKILNSKFVTMEAAIVQLKAQISVKVDLEKTIKEYEERNKYLAETIIKQEASVEELMKQAT